MIDITKKVAQMRENARLNLTDEDDFFNEVKGHLFNAENIREKNKLHNDGKSKLLLETFLKEKAALLKKQETDSEFDWKDYYRELKKHYLKYARKNAKLDRIGNSIVFLDSATERYLRIVRFENIDRDGVKHDRLSTVRIKQNVVNAYIDKECKKLIGDVLMSEQVTMIRRDLNLYTKEFEPLKPRFIDDEFFNTYTPHGFLDVKIKNKVDIERFVTVSMPTRYPYITALINNIAPALDERIYLLNWFSTILNTAKKTKTAPVLKGIQRTGKGVFATKIIEYAMHEANCFIATNANLSDKFNTYLEDKLFITFDEVKGDFKSQNDLGNIIKQIVSEDKLSIRAMNTDPYMITSYANCIFLSNDDLPIPMDQSDGRFTIIETRSRKLIDVAKTDFKLSIEEFLKALEAERDNFLIHLKMCKYDKKLATSTIENQAKKVIQDATATHEAVLKTAFKHQDIETVSNLLDEAIQDNLTDTLIKRESIVYNQHPETGDTYKSPKFIPFNHNNAKMKELFMEEFNIGYLSNTSLKWFSRALNLEHILKDDKKFGSFWNKILTGGVTVNLKLKDTIHKKNERIKEKFRYIKTNEEVTTFAFDDKNFIFISTTTANQI